MKKAVVMGLFLALLASSSAYAAEVAKDAGNAVCPVSGDKVSGKDFAEYEGKKYGLCCAMCAGKFTKDPEKYLAKMESTESMESMESEEESHEGHDHSM